MDGGVGAGGDRAFCGELVIEGDDMSLRYSMGLELFDENDGAYAKSNRVATVNNGNIHRTTVSSRVNGNVPKAQGGSSPDSSGDGIHETYKKYLVYIGNLTWWTTDRDIEEYLQQINVDDVKDIKVYDNRTNGRSKGYCLVSVGSNASLQNIFNKLPGLEIHGQRPTVAEFSKASHYHLESLALRNIEVGSDKSDSCAANGQVNGGAKERNSPPLANMGTNVNPTVVNRPRAQSTSVPGFGFGPGGHPRMMAGPRFCGGGPPNRMSPPMYGSMMPVQGHRMPNYFPPQGPMGYNNASPMPPGPMPMMTPYEWRHPPANHFPLQGSPPPRSHGPPIMVSGRGHMPNRHMNPANFSPGSHGHPINGLDHVPFNGPPPSLGNRTPETHVLNEDNRDSPPRSLRKSRSPKLSEKDFEEALSRNRQVSSSAISRAVADAGAGEFASAIETLVTAINLIRQTKIANNDRCQILISSLQDTLQGIENQSYGSRRAGRSRSHDRNDRDRYTRTHHGHEGSHCHSRDYRERTPRSRHYDRDYGYSGSRSPSRHHGYVCRN